MTTRERAAWLAALLSALAALSCSQADAPPSLSAARPEARALPDVLLVVIDALRADALPFYGGSRVRAPFLTSVAQRGVVFENAWSASSWTAPATASIFTSLYPFQHGVTMGLRAWRVQRESGAEIELNRIPDAIETIPVWLRSLGYRTFGVADNANVAERTGFARGFDRFRGFDYEGAPRVNAVLREWGSEIRASRPSFVYLHYMEPHVPYHLRAPWFEAPRGGGKLAWKRARYESEIGFLDGHLQEAFGIAAVDDATVVIVTADHGEEFGDHGGREHDFTLYSELTRVPLVVVHPGARPLRLRVRENVSALDVLPTLRAILGQPPSPQDEGRSLTEHYLSPAPPAERTLFSMRTAGLGAEKRQKLIVSSPPEQAEVYDLAADPGERDDLAAQRPELVAELGSRWRRFESGARRWQRSAETIPVDGETLEQLRRLGYAEEAEAP
jgi:arylsulfatase A-like enzyme